MRDLGGQTAIVTGAGAGIGRGIADVLAAVVAVDLDRTGVGVPVDGGQTLPEGRLPAEPIAPVAVGGGS